MNTRAKYSQRLQHHSDTSENDYWNDLDALSSMHTGMGAPPLHDSSLPLLDVQTTANVAGVTAPGSLEMPNTGDMAFLKSLLVLDTPQMNEPAFSYHGAGSDGLPLDNNIHSANSDAFTKVPPLQDSTNLLSANKVQALSAHHQQERKWTDSSAVGGMSSAPTCTPNFQSAKQQQQQQQRSSPVRMAPYPSWIPRHASAPSSSPSSPSLSSRAGSPSKPMTSRMNMGAATIGKETSICSNCQTTKSPAWRRSSIDHSLLCNACGLYVKQHGRNRVLSPRENGGALRVKRTPVLPERKAASAEKKNLQRHQQQILQQQWDQSTAMRPLSEHWHMSEWPSSQTEWLEQEQNELPLRQELEFNGDVAHLFYYQQRQPK